MLELGHESQQRAEFAPRLAVDLQTWRRRDLPFQKGPSCKAVYALFSISQVLVETCAEKNRSLKDTEHVHGRSEQASHTLEGKKGVAFIFN